MFESADQIINWLKVSKGLILATEVSSTTAEALSTDVPVTFLTSAAAETRTLPNAKEGQLKIIVAKATLTGTVTLTPTNLANGTTLAFDAAGDFWIGIFHAGEWHGLVTIPGVS
jgi:hypothetical protein